MTPDKQREVEEVCTIADEAYKAGVELLFLSTLTFLVWPSGRLAVTL